MKKRDTESMRSRVQALTADLERQVQELFDSDRYREFLDAMAKFHHYSLNNSLLILMQRPDAEQVASFATWKKLGRQVKTGEKGIRILVPVPVRGKKEKLKDGRNADTDGIKSIEGEDEKCSRLFFKIGHVWDIAQTEGAPLPSLTVRELEGNVADYRERMRTAERLSPVPLRFDRIDGGAKGYFSPAKKEIVIRQDLSERHSFHTALHELTHALLHCRGIDRKIDRETNEVIAESVSYVVCRALQIDTKEYSCGYICGWSRDREMAELKASLAIIKDLSAELIPAFEMTGMAG